MLFTFWRIKHVALLQLGPPERTRTHTTGTTMTNVRAPLAAFVSKSRSFYLDVGLLGLTCPLAALSSIFKQALNSSVSISIRSVSISIHSISISISSLLCPPRLCCHRCLRGWVRPCWKRNAQTLLLCVHPQRHALVILAARVPGLTAH